MGLKVREAGVFVDVCQGGPPAPTPWVRNAAWPALTAPGAAEQKIVGLYAVWPGDGTGNGGNFFAFNAQGAYNIDFGDGTVTDYATNTQANYEYDFNDAALNGTNRPVTFTDTGDTVNRTAHGLANGAIVRFYGIVTTTGVLVKTPYFVVNATADTFQVALTAGGAALPLTGDGSATLLPHKVALVTITPQSAQNLTAANFNLRHNATALQAYTTGWLDVAFALPNVSGANLIFGGFTVGHRLVECVNIVSVGALTTMANLFTDCRLLQSIPALPDATAVETMASMFQNCNSLTAIPPFPGSVAAVTTMSTMFQNCNSLTAIPPFPGSVAAVMFMNSMFGACNSLTTIPPFPGSVAAVTNMSAMFQACSSLTTIPPFPGSVAAVTAMNSMFQNCNSLTTIPPFPGSVAAVTNMASMFNACNTLTTIPPFPGSTAAVTNMALMFSGCNALTAIPVLDTTGVSSNFNLTSAFQPCNSLTRIQATGQRFNCSVAECKLSAVALNELFTGLPTVTARTITVTGNYGITEGGYDATIATAKGWTVTP